jgi:two-component system OmpR family sensor kinase
MRQPSIRRHLLVWVLGALCAGALILVFAAYRLTLREIDEALDDGLRQTALLLADRDLAGALPIGPVEHLAAAADTESKLVAIARRHDGSLLFSSEPKMALDFQLVPGPSLQTASDAPWHVFTVVQGDRIIQVAQPVSVRREMAAESASQLLLPLVGLVAMIGAMLVFALRRGLRPLSAMTDALAERSAASLAPLEVDKMPMELLPMVGTLNELLVRLGAAFEAQQHFVADAAHELRSPVTALQLQVQLLERSRDPAQRQLATQELSAGIARTRRLIEQLLYLSRAAADERVGEIFARAPVRLGDVAREVVARWSQEAERRGVDLGADAQPVAAVQANHAQIDMLLSNLVENALRYAGKNGVVDVIATEFDGAPALRVIDNGPGIEPAERSRVFDRFYRSPGAVATAEPGSGLGLAIVKAIADQHGAVVSLHAGAEGRGLEVRVVFAKPS